MKRTYVNITTVSLPPDEAARFKEAVEYYGFEGLSTFFKRAGRTLIDHYDRREGLVTPLAFITTDNHARKTN